MSATGSGISEIFGYTLAAGGAAGSQVNFTHNLGMRAVQVYCCDATTGRQLDGTEISVAQPTANVVQIANVTTGAVVVNISIRWQYDSVELDTVPTTDTRLQAAVGPPPVAVGIAGGGALNQVTYWTGAATIAGNAMLTTDPATGDLDRIKNVPYDWPAANAVGVLTNDGAGNLTWAPAGGGGANTALSNLAAVAVNAALNPGLDNTIGIGTSALRWSAVNATSLFARDDATNTVRTQYGATAITTAAGGAGFTLDASAPGETLNIFSDGAMLLASGSGGVQIFGSGVTAVALFGSGSGDDIAIGGGQMNRMIVNGSNGMRLESAQGPVNGGTAALPAFALGLATTTGFFQDVVSELGVTNAGVETMRFTADNALEVNASTAAVSAAGKGRIRYLAASNTLQISNNGGAYAGLIGGSTTLVNGRVTLSSAGATITDNANLTFNGTVLAINQDGTAALPSLTMGTAADPDTGIFHPAANELAFSAGASERIRIRLSSAVNGTPRVAVTIGTLTGDGEWGIFETGTFTSGALNNAYMLRVDATGAGSAAGQQHSGLFNMLPGYTGTARNSGVWGNNSTVQAAPAVGDLNNINAAIGVFGRAAGASAGYNFGLAGLAEGSSGAALPNALYIGVYARAKGSIVQGTSIGVFARGGHGGSGTTRVGGYFSTDPDSTPTFVNGALIADSPFSGEPIFLGRNGGTTRFTIAETGVVSVGIDGTAALPALTFGATADPNTGIFHPAADTLALSTNSTEAMRIISTGEIGIGNAITPASNVMVQATRSVNSGLSVGVTNSQVGTAAASSFVASSDAGALVMTAFSSGYTTSEAAIASAARIQSSNGLTGGLVITTRASGAPILFYSNTGGVETEKARMFGTSGNWAFGGTSDQGQVTVDNGATAESILVLRDNGTTVVTVADGGDVGIGVTPTEKMSLKDHTAFAGSETQLTTGAVQTADGTTTPAKTLALSDNTLYWFEADIIGRQTGGTDRAYYKVAGLFYRQGGGAATLEGAVASVITAIETAGAAAWNATLAASGNNVVVNVTGAAATTINWTCTVRYQAVSGNA